MKKLSTNQLNRIPRYLMILKDLENQGIEYVSSQFLASSLSLNNEQVRKDIALISSIDGIPNKGREVSRLIKDIERLIGVDALNNAVLVGVGSLGSALLRYKGFKNYNLNIVAAFDQDEEVIGTQVNEIFIYNIKDIKDVVKTLNARIGIITTPASQAQKVADTMVEAGIEAIWNFAPAVLNVDESIIVSNVDMAASLATLSHKLYIKYRKKEK